MLDKEVIFCYPIESGEQFNTKVKQGANLHRARKIAGFAVALMAVGGFGMGALSNEVSASELPVCTLSNDSNNDGISYLETEVSDGRWKLEDYANSGDWAPQPISIEDFIANQPEEVSGLGAQDVVPDDQKIWRLGKCAKIVNASNSASEDAYVTQTSSKKTDLGIKKANEKEENSTDWHLDMVLGGVVGLLLTRFSIRRRIESQKRRNEELKRATGSIR